MATAGLSGAVYTVVSLEELDVPVECLAQTDQTAPTALQRLRAVGAQADGGVLPNVRLSLWPAWQQGLLTSALAIEVHLTQFGFPAMAAELKGTESTQPRSPKCCAAGEAEFRAPMPRAWTLTISPCGSQGRCSMLWFDPASRRRASRARLRVRLHSAVASGGGSGTHPGEDWLNVSQEQPIYEQLIAELGDIPTQVRSEAERTLRNLEQVMGSGAPAADALPQQVRPFTPMR